MSSRRDFLQKLGSTAAAFPFLNIDPSASYAPYSVQDGEVLRVALMGLGSYAKG